MNIQDRIREQLKKNRVVLYMKGTPDFPQCGFSAKAVDLLRKCNATFDSYNILEDAELRQGIKEFGNWPTIPQLYVDEELVGGSDIMTELFASGELKDILASKQ